MKHFTAQKDIFLLTQANLARPWRQTKIMEAWSAIADILSESPAFGVRDKQSCRSRFYRLLNDYKEGKRTALNKGANTDEIAEKSQLLDDSVQDMDEHAASAEEARAKRTAEKRHLDTDGQVICDAAIGTLQELTPTTNERSPKRQKILENFLSDCDKRQNDIKDAQKEKMDLWKRQPDLQEAQMQQHHTLLQRQIDLQQQQFTLLLDLVRRFAPQ